LVVLIELIVKEKKVKYLTIISKEDSQTTDGAIVYKQISIDAKLKTRKRCQKQSWLGEVH